MTYPSPKMGSQMQPRDQLRDVCCHLANMMKSNVSICQITLNFVNLTVFPSSLSWLQQLRCRLNIGHSFMYNSAANKQIILIYWSTGVDQISPEASISTGILGLYPTTFEVYRLHRISGPDQVLGRCWRRQHIGHKCHVSQFTQEYYLWTFRHCQAAI